MMQVINVHEKFNLFQDHWSPKVIGSLNNQHVKLVKVHGELIWHSHEEEDELFFVIKGKLKLCFEGKNMIVKEGEMLIVPKQVRHKPIAEKECWLLLFEPAGIKHTGNEQCEYTKTHFDKL